MEFFFACDDLAARSRLERALSARGYALRAIRGDDCWLVGATDSSPVDVALARAEELERLADELGAEYDGWEMPVPPETESSP
jgi:hypothetical protein